MQYCFVNWTSVTPAGLRSHPSLHSPLREPAHFAQFWCNANSLESTLANPLVCVANKGFSDSVSLLDATLTRNTGWGPVMVNQTSPHGSQSRATGALFASAIPSGAVGREASLFFTSL